MADPDSNFASKPTPRWIEFVTKNPHLSACLVIFSFACNLLAIPGFIVTSLGTHYSREGLASRQFFFYLVPEKEQAMQTQIRSRVDWTYKSTTNGDVTVCYLGCWSAGKQSIHKNEILAPITFEPDSITTKVLEVEMLRTTRSVVHEVAERSNFNENEFLISWDILEHNDAFLMRVTCKGPPPVFEFSGMIEGQPDLVKLYPQSERLPFWRSPYALLLGNLATIVSFGVLLMATTAHNWLRSRSQIVRVMLTLWLVCLVVAGIFEASSSVKYFKNQMNLPPAPPKFLKLRYSDLVSG